MKYKIKQSIFWLSIALLAFGFAMSKAIDNARTRSALIQASIEYDNGCTTDYDCEMKFGYNIGA